MKKTILATVTLVLTGLALTGCSAIHSGVVTQKEYRAPYTYTSMYCASYNSKGGCSMYLPMTHYVPAEYILDIKQGKDTGWINTDPDTYAKTKVGDYVEEGH